MHVEFLTVEKPSNVAVSAARTCYFPNGIVTPQKSEGWDRKESLLLGIFKGGHHTTLMHTNITMMISGISRHLIWRLLHAHPYYNSEQVSQRYAKMKIDNFVYPQDGNKTLWQSYYQACFEDYEKLREILHPDVLAVVPKFRRKDSMKKAQEMARYILPGGMSAYLYHTVNIITILRYIAVAKSMPESQKEAIKFAEILSDKLLETDESLRPLIEHANASEPQFPLFDMLGLKGKIGLEKEQVKVYDVIIIDDIGYVQQSREEMEVLFTFLAERYERKSLMISSNLIFSEWDKIFKDPMTTMAAIDRLVHHSVILEFNEGSIREMQAKKIKNKRGVGFPSLRWSTISGRGTR